MSNLRISTWVITGIFLLLFIVKWSNAFSITNQYGSLGTSLPYILGLITFYGLIPTIMWVIVYFKEKKK